jgi:hypothetical protein
MINNETSFFIRAISSMGVINKSQRCYVMFIG